jgi:C4-dicarboxylate-specific signal transduction histidine kinase
VETTLRLPGILPVRWANRLASAPALLFAACWLAMPPPALAVNANSVLVLYSNGRLLPANIEVDNGLAEAFAARPDLPVDPSAEFLESAKFRGESYERILVAYLREKYRARPPAVIVTGAEAALDFVLRNRSQLFPQAPIVHVAVSSDYLRSIPPLPPDVVGSALTYDFIGTVEQALRWRPAARRLVVVTGTGAWDREWEARLRSQAAAFAGRLSLEFLAGLPTDALLKQLRTLGGDAIVFSPGYFSDGDGHLFTPREAIGLIAEASPAPVYGPFSTFIGSGIVGGKIADYRSIGRQGGQAVLDLLAGAVPASLALPKAMPEPYEIDWRQARRWGIAAQDIPPGAIVHFREPTFWEAYRQWVLIAGAVMLLQAGLIATLLFERRRRQRATAALAQSQLYMNLAAHAAGLSMWRVDADVTREGMIEPSSLQGAPGPDLLEDFRETLARIHPQDRERVEHATRNALDRGEELDIEYRVTGADGEVRWHSARGRAERGHDRQMLGVVMDITPRKRAEIQAELDHAALRHMTRVSLLGQLSASIAHQLNQPLAAILGNAEAAQAMLGREPVDMLELREICNDIVAEDHRAAEVIRRLGALFKRGEPTFAAMDVSELVRDTVELARANLLARHVVPTLRLAPDLPQLSGDRVQLQQLLLNLIVNATDAMEAIPELERELTISAEAQAGEILLCVADRGPGIPADAMDKLFEPFWSTKAAGMGIGLAVCRSIAVAHRGSLTAANAPAGGAIFCTRLPAAAAP